MTAVSGVSYHRLMMPLVRLSQDYGIEVTCLINNADDFLEKLDGVTHVIFNRNISELMKREETILILKQEVLRLFAM